MASSGIVDSFPRLLGLTGSPAMELKEKNIEIKCKFSLTEFILTDLVVPGGGSLPLILAQLKRFDDRLEFQIGFLDFLVQDGQRLRVLVNVE